MVLCYTLCTPGSNTPTIFTGETVLEPESLQEHKVVMRSGSLVRNSGARVSWRMVPSSTSAASRESVKESSNQHLTKVALEPSDKPGEKEVVLREVEDSKEVDEGEIERKGGTDLFQTTVTVTSSSAAGAGGQVLTG